MVEFVVSRLQFQLDQQLNVVFLVPRLDIHGIHAGVRVDIEPALRLFAVIVIQISSLDSAPWLSIFFCHDQRLLPCINRVWIFVNVEGRPNLMIWHQLWNMILVVMKVWQARIRFLWSDQHSAPCWILQGHFHGLILWSFRLFGWILLIWIMNWQWFQTYNRSNAQFIISVSIIWGIPILLYSIKWAAIGIKRVFSIEMIWGDLQFLLDFIHFFDLVDSASRFWIALQKIIALVMDNLVKWVATCLLRLFNPLLLAVLIHHFLLEIVLWIFGLLWLLFELIRFVLYFIQYFYLLFHFVNFLWLVEHLFYFKN